jgi:hypothetical protein
MNEHSNHKRAIRWCLDALIILAWSTYLISTIDLDFISTHNAWNGYSIAEIINILNDPERYKYDYVAQGMISSFQNSQYFALASWISRSFGINSLCMQQSLIALEIFSISMAGYALPLIRKTRYGIIEGSLCMILLSASHAVDFDWGRWGWVYYGQTYIFPYCIWICSLILVRQNQLLKAGLVLLIVSLIHPVLGLLGGLSTLLFQGSNQLLLNRKGGELKIRKLVQSSLKIIAPTLSYCLIIFASKSLSSATLVSAYDFVTWTKNTSYHWYPWTEGLFKDTTMNIYPYTSIIIGAVAIELSANRIVNAGEKNRILLYPSLFLMTILSVLGVIASEVSFSPTIVKLAVFRVSAFALILVIPLFVEAFARPILFSSKSQGICIWRLSGQGKPEVKFFTVLSSLIYLTSSLSGAYLWPMLMLISITSVAFLYTSNIAGLQARLLFIVTGGAALAVAIAETFSNEIIISAFLSANNFFLLAFAAFASLAICFIPQLFSIWFGIRGNQANGLVTTFLIALWIFILPTHLISRRHSVILAHIDPSVNRKTIDAYQQIQLCAKSKLAKTSLVMPPLDRAYGWRSGSELMSTGSARDWAITWIYTSDVKVFREGKRRLQLLGMRQWLKFNHDANRFKGIISFDRELDVILNSMGQIELMNLAKRLGATHLVIDLTRSRSHAKGINPLAVCENEYYALIPSSATLNVRVIPK